MSLKVNMLFSAIYIILMNFLAVSGRALKSNSEIFSTPNNCEVCLTKECIAAAKYYKSRMDTTVDPCEDFYQFTCGSFIKNSANLTNSSLVVHPMYKIQDEVDEELLVLMKENIKHSDLSSIKKVKTYYQNCMNTTRIEEDGYGPILDLLETFGGWPIVSGSNWDENQFNLTHSLQELMKKNHQLSFPFKLSVIPKFTDSSKSILAIEAPKMIYDKAFLTNNSKLPAAYLNYLKKASTLLGADELKCHQEAVEIQTFESTIYNASINSPYKPHQIPIGELTKYVNTSIPWLEILNIILNPSGIYIDENEYVLVEQIEFFSKLFELIEETPKRILANYLGWTVVNENMPYLPEKLRSLNTDFWNMRLGINDMPSREKKCIKNVQANLDIGVSSMYLKKYFDRQIKDDVQDMFRAIKDQMKNNLLAIDWMDEKTKQKALEKFDAMRTNIAYPDELLDDQEVDYYYRELEIYPGNYLSSALNVSSFKRDQIYQRMLKWDKYSWKSMRSSAKINAYYHIQLNLIGISAALLRGHLFQNNRPEYLNFGGIGTTIGHEITHAVDKVSRFFDKNGNVGNFWSTSSLSKYTEKENCFIDQYNNFIVRGVNMKLNGTETLHENVADNGGTKAAYYAYNEWATNRTTEKCLPEMTNYTPQQMFWISAASDWCSVQSHDRLTYLLATDIHSPNEARVSVTYSNIPEFARDFQCKVGSRMNPEKKCVVW